MGCTVSKLPADEAKPEEAKQSNTEKKEEPKPNAAKPEEAKPSNEEKKAGPKPDAVTADFSAEVVNVVDGVLGEALAKFDVNGLVDEVVDEVLAESAAEPESAAEAPVAVVEDSKALLASHPSPPLRDYSDVPKSHWSVLKSVSKFIGSMKKEEPVYEDKIIEEVMKAEEVTEAQIQLVLDTIEDTNGMYDQEALNAGVTAHKATLAEVAVNVIKVQTIIAEMTDKTLEEKTEAAKIKLLACSAILDGAGSQSLNSTSKKTMSIRSLALVGEWWVETKASEVEEKDDIDMAAVMKAEMEAIIDGLLSEYNAAEADILDLITADGRMTELRACWKECDSNGSRKLATTEFNAWARTKYPLFVQPRANQVAYKKTCAGGDGDDWVERKEFALLLKNMAFYNKVYFVFDLMDSSGDGRVAKMEFTAFATKLLPMLSPEALHEAMGPIMEAADKNDGGYVTFLEYVDFIMSEDAKLFLLAEKLMPIADEEEDC